MDGDDSRVLRTSLDLHLRFSLPRAHPSSQPARTGAWCLHSHFVQETHTGRGGCSGAEARGTHPGGELGAKLGLLVGFTYVLRSVNFG